MKFLIVGSGYIGKVLEDEIVKTGHSFVSFDNNLLGLTKEAIDNKGNITIIDDTLNKDGKLAKFKDYDVLVNTAAVVGDPACLIDTRFALENNCVGTRNMVEKAKGENKHFIHLSTCSLYGSENCSTEKPLTELDNTFPIDFYGQTKFQQERFVLESGIKEQTIFRLGTAYGQSPRMRYDLVIPTFVAKAVNDKKLCVFGGEQWRPFVHIRDIARAIIWSAEKKMYGLFNLANENYTIKQLALAVKSKIDTEVELNKMITDPRNYIVSSKKIIDSGFEFRWNVITGIDEMKYTETINEYDRAVYSNHKLMQLKKLGVKL